MIHLKHVVVKLAHGKRNAKPPVALDLAGDGPSRTAPRPLLGKRGLRESWTGGTPEKKVGSSGKKRHPKCAKRSDEARKEGRREGGTEARTEKGKEGRKEGKKEKREGNKEGRKERRRE